MTDQQAIHAPACLAAPVDPLRHLPMQISIAREIEFHLGTLASNLSERFRHTKGRKAHPAVQ